MKYGECVQQVIANTSFLLFIIVIAIIAIISKKRIERIRNEREIELQLSRGKYIENILQRHSLGRYKYEEIVQSHIFEKELYKIITHYYIGCITLFIIYYYTHNLKPFMKNDNVFYEQEIFIVFSYFCVFILIALIIHITIMDGFKTIKIDLPFFKHNMDSVNTELKSHYEHYYNLSHITEQRNLGINNFLSSNIYINEIESIEPISKYKLKLLIHKLFLYYSNNEINQIKVHYFEKNESDDDSIILDNLKKIESDTIWFNRNNMSIGSNTNYPDKYDPEKEIYEYNEATLEDLALSIYNDDYSIIKNGNYYITFIQLKLASLDRIRAYIIYKSYFEIPFHELHSLMLTLRIMDLEIFTLKELIPNFNE